MLSYLILPDAHALPEMEQLKHILLSLQVSKEISYDNGA